MWFSKRPERESRVCGALHSGVSSACNAHADAGSINVGRRGPEDLGDGLGGRVLCKAARAGARLCLEHILAELQLLGRRLLGLEVDMEEGQRPRNAV